VAKISELKTTSNLSGRERVVLVQGGETKQADAGELVEALAAPSVSRTEIARDGAEAAALAALIALGDGIYDNVAEGLAATEDGEGFYVRDDAGGSPSG
jgi:UDP-N-acetylmuramoylalanine-D-glutamate ligase